MWAALTRGRLFAKKDVVLGNDGIETPIEFNMLINFGPVNMYVGNSSFGRSSNFLLEVLGRRKDTKAIVALYNRVYHVGLADTKRSALMIDDEQVSTPYLSVRNNSQELCNCRRLWLTLVNVLPSPGLDDVRVELLASMDPFEITIQHRQIMTRSHSRLVVQPIQIAWSSHSPNSIVPSIKAGSTSQACIKRTRRAPPADCLLTIASMAGHERLDIPPT